MEQIKSLPADMLKLMKTQDVGYIAMQKNSNLKKLKAAEEDLSLAELATKSPTRGSHIYFAEDMDEKNQLSTHLQASFSRSRKTTADAVDPTLVADALAQLDDSPATKELKRRRAVVLARRARVEQLEKLESKLQLDRQLLGKGSRKKIGSDEYGFGKYKWALERKK